MAISVFYNLVSMLEFTFIFMNTLFYKARNLKGYKVNHRPTKKKKRIFSRNLPYGKQTKAH